MTNHPSSVASPGHTMAWPLLGAALPRPLMYAKVMTRLPQEHGWRAGLAVPHLSARITLSASGGVGGHGRGGRGGETS